MKYTIICLLLLLSFSSINLRSDDRELINDDTYLLEKFVGKWKLLYKFIPEKEPSSAGRGVMNGQIFLDKRVVELEQDIRHYQLNIKNKLILGFDHVNQHFFFLTLDSRGETPEVATGKYNSDENKILLTSESVDKQVEIYFEREDKIKITFYDKKLKKNFLEYVYILEE